MDFYKLKLEAYQRIAVTNKPSGIKLPFDTVESDYDCLLAFVQTEAQVHEAIASVVTAGSGRGLILVYPKGTSKKYNAKINRDSIIAIIKGQNGFKAPRLVSLDQDWSAFSFKYVGDAA